MKNLYHAGRKKYERTLHPVRHLVARRRLSSGQRPRRILVLCYGNVCRSPYLQAALQRGLPDVEVTSAGFMGNGRAVPAIALAIGQQRGIDLSGHRSQLVSLWRVADADLVIVMDAEQATRVVRSFPIKRSKIMVAPDLASRFEVARSIRDPWNQSVETFMASFDHLDRCAATLVSILGKAS
jgi:protein-tyrosine phosphatase